MNANANDHDANDDGLDDLVAAADAVAADIPSADDVVARAKRAADLERQAAGSLKPVDSGQAMNPRLRVLAPKPK